MPKRPAAKKKSGSGAAKSEASGGPRRLKPKHHKFLRYRNRDKSVVPVKLPSAWKMTKQAARTLWRHKRLFVGITVIYGILNLLLAQGLGGTDVSGVKTAFNQAFTGHFGSLLSGLSVFTLLVGSAGNNTSQTSGSYQILLAIVASLAIIWGLRQSLSDTLVGVRDAYYKGMYPLVPFILVLLVIALQLVPIVIGSSLYSLVVTNGIAVQAGEKLFWFAIFAASAFATLYMLSSSLFALYIVTLPDMTPMKALRSARGLVRRRRWAVLRKLLWMPIFLLVVAAIIMVPIIILLAPVARWIFFLLTMSALTAAHAYMYTFYRELLNE